MTAVDEVAAEGHRRQVAAFEQQGALDFHLVDLMLGHALVDRWELWQPTIESMDRDHPYPNFDALVHKLRALKSSDA